MSRPRRGRDPARERIAAAMVALVAERGFEAVEVALLCERAQAGRAHFARCFAGLEDCLVVVHDEAMAELCGEIEAACAGRDHWHDRVWAAGVVAGRFLAEDPLRARFLLVGINGVGGGAADRRDRIVAAIAELLDGGREEPDEEGARRRTSRCTAEIAAGAIYNTLQAKILAGETERGEDFLPELIYLATMPYLGQDAAEDELAVQPLR